MLFHRVLTALAGVPVVLAGVWFGPPWITVLAVVAAIIGVREAYRLYPTSTRTPEDDGIEDTPLPVEDTPFPVVEDTPLPVLLGGAWAVALVLAGELAVRPADFGWAVLGICAVGMVVAGLWMIAAWHGQRPVAAAGYLVLSPVYIGGALACATALRGIDGLPRIWRAKADSQAPSISLPPSIEDDGISEPFEIAPDIPAGDGGFWLLPDITGPDLAQEAAVLTETGCWWLLLAILTVYAADTGAYAAGRLLGRHRMAPSISPGKTWEGTAGGMLAAVITAVVIGGLFSLKLEIWQLVTIGVILGTLSPIGDLLESKVKRLADAKDSGNLFPGHGGMLDRLDSILPCLIVVYVLAAVSTP